MTTIIPVIHYLNPTQARLNLSLAKQRYLPAMLIDMTGAPTSWFEDQIKPLREEFSDMKLGVNFLGLPPDKAVESSLRLGFDMTWTDACLTREDVPGKEQRDTICQYIQNQLEGKDHLFFCGVAFKYQIPDLFPTTSAIKASNYGFVSCTSGTATGKAPDLEKLKRLRAAIGTSPLAVASGVAPENIASFSNYVDFALVASSILKKNPATPEEIDPVKLDKLLEQLKA